MKGYSEKDVTWSSIEKDVPYAKVIWSTQKNGIPKFTFIGEEEVFY